MGDCKSTRIHFRPTAPTGMEGPIHPEQLGPRTGAGNKKKKSLDTGGYGCPWNSLEFPNTKKER